MTSPPSLFDQAIADFQALDDTQFIAMAERMGFTVERVQAVNSDAQTPSLDNELKPKITREASQALIRHLEQDNVRDDLIDGVKAQSAEIQRLNDYISVMIGKMVKSHRPAYDEMAQKMGQLEAELEASQKKAKTMHEDVIRRLPLELLHKYGKSWRDSLRIINLMKD